MTQNGRSREGPGGWATLSRLLGYVTPYWEFKAVIALILLNTVVSIMSPAIVGGIIDMVGFVAGGGSALEAPRVGGPAGLILSPLTTYFQSRGIQGGRALLAIYSLSLIVFAVFEGGLSYLQRYLLEVVSQRAGYEIRMDMYNSLLEKSFSFYDRQKTGQLMARATGDINMLGRFINFGFRMSVSNLLLVLMVLYSMASISPRLTGLALVFIAVLLATTTRYSRMIRPLWQAIRELYGEVTSVVQESLAGIRVVKGFHRESYEEKRFKGVAQRYFDVTLKSVRLRSFYRPLVSLISEVGSIVLLVYGGFLVVEGSLTLGSVVAFYFYMRRLMGPVRMLGFLTGMFVRAQAAAERVFEVIDARVEVRDKPGALELGRVRGDVVFEDVWFSYDGENMVLKGVNLEVKAGQRVAILGATGSGKTSIINLIPRFYDVTKGSIRVDGVDVRDVTIKSLRRQIGIVRQEPFIFKKTIRENIAYGVEDAPLSKVVEAAKKANIHDFIASLPQGYDTLVGERGVTLSGGQRQRIAIARAILKDPRILILDDSTSSVDTKTEFEIQEALAELLRGRTTFIITQRLSSVKGADYIVVLEDGVIREEGTHEELMELGGVYRQLYQTQIAGAEEGV